MRDDEPPLEMPTLAEDGEDSEDQSADASAAPAGTTDDHTGQSNDDQAPTAPDSDTEPDSWVPV